MHPKKYRQPRKNSSENVNSQFGRAALFLKKENFSAKLSRRWKRIRAALLAEFPFQAFIMITFGTIWGWDLYILPKIAEYKLKDANNIKHGCLTYKKFIKSKSGTITIIFLLNNHKEVYSNDIIPPSVILYLPSNSHYWEFRDAVIQENNTKYCRPIEYIELISLPFWQEIYVYRFK